MTYRKLKNIYRLILQSPMSKYLIPEGVLTVESMMNSRLSDANEGFLKDFYPKVAILNNYYN